MITMINLKPTINVPCQFVASYDSLLTYTRDWIIVPTRKGPLAAPACQDIADIHPVKYERSL